MPMTQKEVDRLPTIKLPRGAYESVQRLKCPQCKGRLTPEAVRDYSTDGLELPGVVRTRVIPDAGCEPCGILYRLGENPIVARSVW